MAKSAVKMKLVRVEQPLPVIVSHDKLVEKIEDIPWAYVWAEHFESLADFEHLTGDIHHTENGLRNVVTKILKEIESFKAKHESRI